MTFTPAVKQMCVQQQGAQAFPYNSEWVDNVAVSAGVASTYDLSAARTAMGLAQTDATKNAGLFVIFGADGPFYYHERKAATVPTTSTADGNASTFSPNQRYIPGDVTSLSFIAAADTKIALQFYKT